jgi:hypothetical protein
MADGHDHSGIERLLERGLGPLALYLLKARPCRIVLEAHRSPLATRARAAARPI